MNRIGVSAFLVGVLVAGVGNAAVVFLQPPVDHGVSFGASLGSQISDDFTLSSASSITEMRWWGGEGLPTTPITDTFSIRFFSDSGLGTPQVTPFLSLLVLNPTRNPTGMIALPGQPIFEYRAPLPQAVALLGNETYYVSVVAQSFNWGWAASNHAGASWVRGLDGQVWTPRLNPSADLAFELPAPIPEPATYMMLGAGLGLVMFVSMRRRYRQRRAMSTLA